MENNEIFYYEAEYEYEDTVNGVVGYKNRTQYGFVYANNYAAAAKIIEDYFSNDLVKISLESIGYLDLLGIHNKELAESFKKQFMSEL